MWNGPSSPSRNSTSIANISSVSAKASLANKDNNGRKSFSEESHDLLHQQNGHNNGANNKEHGRNGRAESSNSHSDSSKRGSPDSNGKDPGFESAHPISISTPNGAETSSEDRHNSENIHSDAESRKKVSSIDALINKSSPPTTSQPTIVYPLLASPGLMMDGIMPMKRMRHVAATEPANEDLPEAPFRRPQENTSETNNTHKRNYEAALGALTSMSTHIQQDEYERQKKRQRLDPDAEVIVVPAAMANRDVHNGKMPVFIGQALNIGTLNEKDLVIKSLSEELRKTQTKLRDYEHLEREREIKRQEEERWINMVVDYPRPTMPMYAQNTNNAAYIQSLPTVPSLGNTVPSLSSLGNSSGSQANSTTGPNPTGMPREPSNSSMPPSVTIPATNPTPNNNLPSVGSGPNNPIIMMSTIAPNGSGHKSPPPTSGTVSPVPGQVIPPMKLNAAPAFQLHVASQPPARVVYQRILKPFPQVQVLGPHQQYQNLYIEATLLRRDTHEEVPHLDGNTLVRVWNGFATFRKLKVTSTSQQSGTLFQLKFSLKQYDSANFKPMACNTVISEPIEVFSHSQYLKQ